MLTACLPSRISQWDIKHKGDSQQAAAVSYDPLEGAVKITPPADFSVVFKLLITTFSLGVQPPANSCCHRCV